MKESEKTESEKISFALNSVMEYPKGKVWKINSVAFVNDEKIYVVTSGEWVVFVNEIEAESEDKRWFYMNLNRAHKLKPPSPVDLSPDSDLPQDQ